jgi:hypothetical protein
LKKKLFQIKLAGRPFEGGGLVSLKEDELKLCRDGTRGDFRDVS